MAERSESIDHYSCETCGAAADLSRDDIFSDYEHEIIQYLMDMSEDLYSVYYSDNRLASYDLAVPVSVSCSNEDCEDYITVMLLVRANPEWEYDNPLSDHVPRPERFEIEVLQILQPGTKPDTRICLDDYIDDLDIGNNADAPNYKALRIICKTKMNMNYCYMAYDEQGNRLLRPIFNTQRNECCWPRDAETSFDVGSLVIFNVVLHPDDAGDHPTPYPHANEDTVVERDASPSSIDSRPWNFGSLEMIAREHVHDIFPLEFLRDQRYVLEESVCPSAGILLITEENIHVMRLYSDKKRLIIIDDGRKYNLPITAESFDEPIRQRNRKYIVILGLGRPFSGTFRQFKPARCYILVIGINMISETDA